MSDYVEKYSCYSGTHVSIEDYESLRQQLSFAHVELGGAQAERDELASAYGTILEENTGLRQQLAEAKRNNLVPGALRCAKCNFVLLRNNLNVNQGTVTAGSNESEPCPNGCGPLWQISWKEWATDHAEQSEKFFDELKSVKKHLAEAIKEQDEIDQQRLKFELLHDEALEKLAEANAKLEGREKLIIELCSKIDQLEAAEKFPNCTLECGAHGTYCKCKAEASAKLEARNLPGIGLDGLKRKVSEALKSHDVHANYIAAVIDDAAEIAIAEAAEKQEPVAWLLTGGSVYADRAFIQKEVAEAAARDRDDGSFLKALCAATVPPTKLPETL